MCGIAGQISLTEDLRKLEQDYIKMQLTLERRGPDESGVYLKEDVALIHRRLSVIDIENGKQPMIFKQGDRGYVIVYNGELYNTKEIRDELIDCGFDFVGHSDTEVVLKSFVKWGAECVDKFNGIFAFSVWDEKEKKLFFARDRIGVKPFFYTIVGDSFIFASELKTLLAHSSVRPQIDENSIAEIMLIGPGTTPGCGVFKGINELPPACCGYYDNGKLSYRKYWELTDKEHRDNFEQTVETVRYLLCDSIERQLVSDVPVCTFLSGGLDSSIISSVASRYFNSKGKQLDTYSVDYKDNDKNFKKSKFQPNSDTQYMKLMAAYLKSNKHIVELDTPDLVSAVYDAVLARDLPGMVDVDASLLLLCKEIKKTHIVALSGECADEIFGGYPWYRDKDIREKEGFPWAQSTEYRAGFLNGHWKDKIDSSEYVWSRYENTVMSTSKLDGLSDLESRMKEMMRLNFDWFMQTLLTRKDRMSMYNGLEVRVPFCDYRIAEYLYSVPWEYKDYKQYEKGLLREAMKDYLPNEVLWRKKSPYPKTHNPNYLKAVSNKLQQIINKPNSRIFDIVDKDALKELLNTDRQIPWYGQLMTTPQTIAYMLQLNFWLEEYKVEIV